MLVELQGLWRKQEFFINIIQHINQKLEQPLGITNLHITKLSCSQTIRISQKNHIKRYNQSQQTLIWFSIHKSMILANTNKNNNTQNFSASDYSKIMNPSSL